MELLLHEYALPLRDPFTTAHGTRRVMRTLIVELRDGGVSGYGEAPESSVYGARIEAMHAALETARPIIERAEWDDPAELWQRIEPELRQAPFALCALDEAAHDLWGKRLGRPVHRLWGLDPADAPPSDYTIGLDTAANMTAKLERMPGFPVYKIKLGGEDDMAIVRALRQHTDTVFRVDANGGWTAERTIANAAELAGLNVEFIEQPLPAGSWEDAERVHREAALPIVADESCVGEADVDRCAGCFSGVNIKLTKCGGLTPARRMIGRARDLGLNVMAGCMTESTVGISALAQIAPLIDAVDMDGALLLADDVATGVRMEQGRAIYPDRPGTGVELLR